MLFGHLVDRRLVARFGQALAAPGHHALAHAHAQLLELLLLFLGSLRIRVGILDDVRREQDDHFLPLLGIVLLAEEGAGDRNISQARDLISEAGGLLAEQAADHDRVVVLHQDVGGHFGGDL